LQNETTTPKMDRITQKTGILLLSTAVVKVDLKVTDASLTPNQCL